MCQESQVLNSHCWTSSGLISHKPPVAPLRDDALLEVDHVLVARRLRQQEASGGFRFNVRRSVFLQAGRLLPVSGYFPFLSL